MKIVRDLHESLSEELARKEISILLGPRQVGKTFLLNEIRKSAVKRGLRVKSYNLEIPSDLIRFNKSDVDLFHMLSDDVDVVFIDEFHYLKNASKIFKAVFDSGKKVKIFATGSSTIEIHKHLKESLAGRRLVSQLYPLRYSEFLQLRMADHYDRYLLLGGLPGLIHVDTVDEKIRLLNEILATYIQKDIKSLIREENIRAFNTLLYLLADRQGSVISHSSIAGEVGLSANTIDHHLLILENTYVVFPVHSYAKNIGNELKKSKKYYYYDIGMRNALIKDFSPVRKRSDEGVLHESFIFMQLKYRLKPNMELKFWRTKAGDEIDFVLLIDRKPLLIEVKTTARPGEIPPAMKTFIRKYPETLGGIVFSRTGAEDAEFQGKRILFAKHDSFDLILDELIK